MRWQIWFDCPGCGSRLCIYVTDGEHHKAVIDGYEENVWHIDEEGGLHPSLHHVACGFHPEYTVKPKIIKWA